MPWDWRTCGKASRSSCHTIPDAQCKPHRFPILTFSGQALNICCSEQPHEYRPVIDVLSGAVFLGVPHIIKDREAAKKTIDLLLKCKEMGSTRQHADDAGAKYLIQICEGFERIGLRIPVISAYETKSTAPPRSFFRRIFSKVSNQVVSHDLIFF